MNRLVFLGMAGILLLTSSGVARAAERCQAFPAASLTRTECERQEAERARKEEETKRKERESSVGTRPRGTTLSDYTCPGGNPGAVTLFSGSPGETIEGNFLNGFGKTVQGARVSFELVDTQNRIIDRISAAIFPDTLGPGEAGKFRLYLPHRNELSRAWDCFRVIVTEKPPDQIQIR